MNQEPSTERPRDVNPDEARNEWLTRDEARVGARVTHKYSPERFNAGTIVAVDGGRIFVSWDDGSPHHVDELRLLPDEAP